MFLDPFKKLQDRPHYVYDEDPMEAVMEGCFKVALKAANLPPHKTVATEYLTRGELRQLSVDARALSIHWPTLDRGDCPIDTGLICGGFAVIHSSQYELGYYFLMLEDNQYLLYGHDGLIHWAGVYVGVPLESFTYTAHITNRKPITAQGYEPFLAAMEASGYKFTYQHVRRGTRHELLGAPKFEGVLGPMWDGKQGIRYECQETYNGLSQ